MVRSEKNVMASDTSTWLDRIVAFVFALRAITFVWLAFASSIYFPLFADFVLILRYITIPLSVMYLMYQDDLEIDSIYLLIPLIIYWGMLVMNTYGGYNGSYLHELVSIGCFLLMKRKQKILVFTMFFKTIIVLNAISVLLYVIYMAKIPLRFDQMPFYNDGVLASYYRRFALFAILDGGYSLPRLCGIFNEPGALGTVSALLFAASFPYSTKFEKAVLIGSIMASFSLAGYLLAGGYFMLYLIVRNRKYIIVAALMGLCVLVIPHIDWGNDEINRFAQRFVITSEGLSGDNRTRGQFDLEYEAMWQTDEVFWGKGATYDAGGGTASYKNYIMQFGILGFGLFFGSWMIACIYISKKNIYCWLLLIIFIISIYQRPVTLSNAYGYTIVFGGIPALQERLKNRESHLLSN